jgi:flavin-dependent dehydrogenase
MWDVLVAGAGPAGSIAATLLARAGARVLLVDRARFPRDKLCGDSLNPGTLALLDRLNLSTWKNTLGMPIDGMLVTGPGGVRVEGRYPTGFVGRSITRRELDFALVTEAVRAGAQVEDGVAVRRVSVETDSRDGSHRARGLVVSSRRGDTTLSAPVVIAADGRRSAVAFGLGLARHPERPRRWAVGAYFDGVSGMSTLGEMHIRSGEYIGVAPVSGGLTNACLVASATTIGRSRDPEAVLRGALGRDPMLRDRFARASLIVRPTVLGPLAVEVDTPAIAGLLLAGDAAGFIDPMTGDGLRFAVRGAELAAETALEILATGRPDAHFALARRRRQAFASKWRFNRVLRRIVDMPAAVGAAAIGASLAPSVLRSVIRTAGDCNGEEGLGKVRRG